MKLLSLFTVSLLLFIQTTSQAQMESIVHEGEFGIGVGAAHYFGDLNTRARINRPKPAVTAFFRKQFGNYIALRVGATFAQLGYSDIYNKDNEYQRRRNLSFNTNIWELAVQGDFNFFKYVPGDPMYAFTPYVTIGVGAFNYDPYTYLKGQKYFLRPLGTEGQGSPNYPGKKQYSTMAMCLPIGVGIKYSLTDKINLGLEILYRFTTTDYIDDVSTVYAPDAFDKALPDGTPTVWYQLQDRSYETGDPIGSKGRQRGYQNQKDQYVTAMITASFNLTSYRCPSAK